MLVHFKDGIARLNERFPSRALEWLASYVITNSGIILLIKQVPPLFEHAENVRLATLFSQATWGWWALLVGLLRFVFLVINGAMPRTSSYLRALGALLSLFFWFTISYGLFTQDYVSLGLAVYPALFFADLYSVHRASTDMRLADNMDREKKAGSAQGDTTQQRT